MTQTTAKPAAPVVTKHVNVQRFYTGPAALAEAQAQAMLEDRTRAFDGSSPAPRRFGITAKLLQVIIGKTTHFGTTVSFVVECVGPEENIQLWAKAFTEQNDPSTVTGPGKEKK